MRQARIQYLLKRQPGTVHTKHLHCEHQRDLERWVRHWLASRRHALQWSSVIYDLLEQSHSTDKTA